MRKIAAQARNRQKSPKTGHFWQKIAVFGPKIGLFRLEPQFPAWGAFAPAISMEIAVCRRRRFC
jgi:hypothetical protein